MSKKILLLIMISLLSTACFFNKKPMNNKYSNDNINDNDNEPLIIDEYKVENNAITRLFKELQESTKIYFSSIQTLPIIWYSTTGKSADGQMELVAYDMSADKLSGRHLDEVKNFLEKQGFISDPFNIFADKTGTTIGYKKDNIVCLLWEGSSLGDVPNPTIFSLRVQCAFLSELIGGQKDEHNCLIAAGYSWCESKQKCLRTWEENCPSSPNSDAKQSASPENLINQASQLAKNYVLASADYINNRGTNLIITNINTDLCPTCVTVEQSYEYIDPNDPSSLLLNNVTVYIKDGKIQRVE